MTNILAPYVKQQFFTNAGAPNAGGLLYTYAAGTTTPIATYTATGGTNTNPIVLNARGECDLWIQQNVGYKFVLEDAVGNVIWSIDQIINTQLVSLYGGVDTGTANNYALTFNASFTAYADGIILYWMPSNNNTAGSVLNVNGLGNIPILTPAGINITQNTLIAGEPCGVIYKGGNFYLIFVPSMIPQAAGITGMSLTGFSGGPLSVSGNYFRSGNKVTLILTGLSVGTSNATTMTLTGLPSNIKPLTPVQQTCFVQVEDNGAVQLGIASLSAGSSTITFSLGAAGGAFTGSGSKGLPGSYTTITWDAS